jgi:SSS family solute:Na+ symporter
MLICSGIFIPFIYNLKIISVYQYLETRFGGIARTFVAIGFLFTSIMLIGVMVLVPSLVLNALTGLSNLTISSVILVLAVIYTVMGGIKAVIWTDVSQMAILWFGGMVVFIVAIVGSDSSFMHGMEFVRATGKLQSLDFSWGFVINNGVWVSILGYGILHMQYFSADQSQVQRIFTARSMKDVKYSFWFSGVLLNTTYFIFCTLGLILLVFYQGRVFPDPNTIMVDFIVNYVPIGIFGIIVSAIFAASMASIDSLLNSMTTVYVKDIHERWILKNSGATASMFTSRLITLAFGIFTAIFVYSMGDDPKSPLVALMGEYTSYLTGAMFGVFVMAMFTQKTNEIGICLCFVAGIVIVAFMDYTYNFDWGWKSPLGLIVTCLVAYVVSSLTGWEKKDITQYTFAGQRKQLIAEGRIEEDGVYILPGKFEKCSYILLGFFLFQFLFLYYIAS